MYVQGCCYWNRNQGGALELSRLDRASLLRGVDTSGILVGGKEIMASALERSDRGRGRGYCFEGDMYPGWLLMRIKYSGGGRS